MAKFGTKIVLFGYFWVKTLKNYCHIWNEELQISLIPKSCEKTKMPKFGRKSAFFGYFSAGILKNYCHIWNQHLWIWLTENYVNKQKCWNLGPKMPYLGIVHQECLIWVFLGKNKKNYCHIWNQHTWICLIAKYRINLAQKVPYFDIFWRKFENDIVIFEISVFESAKLSICVKKQKSLNLGPKMIYLSVFGLELKRKLLP